VVEEQGQQQGGSIQQYGRRREPLETRRLNKEKEHINMGTLVKTPAMQVQTAFTVDGNAKRQSRQVIAGLEAVTKKYGSHTALNEISLELYRGEVVALLGPNGAGKTTAVRLLLGLTKANSGKVNVFGRDPRERTARVRIGAMLQVGAGAVPENLKVREHIDLFRSYYPKPLPEDEVISIAGLNGIEDRYFGKLSGGQKQRVLFALALCGDPDLLFLDEPTVGMDVEARRGLIDQIRLLAARGKTVLLTTHYLEEADASADRIVVVQKGKVLAEGTPAEIKATQASRNIRCHTSLDLEFLRSLPAVVAAWRDGGTTVIASEEPDSVVRSLIVHDSNVNQLEISNVGLEEAFVALLNQKSN